MKRGHYGNPWRLKLRLTSASAVTPGGFPPRPAAGSGQKKVTCGLLGVSAFIRLRSPTAAQPFTIKHCQPIRPRRSGKPRRLNWQSCHLSARATPAAWRCWRQSRRTSSSSERRKKNPKRRKTAWGPEVLQFRLWAEQQGCFGGMGEPPGPPKLGKSTAHAPQRQLRLCIAQTICSYHSRFRRKGAIFQCVLGRGGDHAPWSVVVVFRPRVVRPCLFWIECLGAEVRRPAVCAPLRNGLPVGKANSALHVGSWWLQVRVMLGS